MRIKFATPYLVNANRYLNLHIQTVRPVYIVDKADGDQVAIAIYDDDLVKEINSYAWLHESELIKYSNKARNEIQDKLNEIWASLEH